MSRIEIATRIEAPPERVFDLARSVDLHLLGQARYRERAIAGVTRGLIGMGEMVTWEARHFGITQRLTSRIVAFDRPRSFRDSMVSGAFAYFDHDHLFEADGPGTRMIDIFELRLAVGSLGETGGLAGADALHEAAGPRTRPLHQARRGERGMEGVAGMTIARAR
jgi:ligand-binding SRPBCC domain-containing protein